MLYQQPFEGIKAGGHLIIATFAPEAPPKCNGLPVQRYTFEQLESVLGGEFELRRSRKEQHIAPGGAEQMFMYCHFRRSALQTLAWARPLSTLPDGRACTVQRRL